MRLSCFKEENDLTKKLKNLLAPDIGLYIFVMALFGVLALFVEQYGLAIAELVITAVLFVVYLVFRGYRRRELQSYIQKP